MSSLLEAPQWGRRVLLEWGQGKVVLKFTTSEEMLPLSSSSQSRVSSCEVYTRMMHFIWSLWTLEERSVCSPSSLDGAGRPTGTWGRTETCQQLEGFIPSLFHFLKDNFLSFPLLSLVFGFCEIQYFLCLRKYSKWNAPQIWQVPST